VNSWLSNKIGVDQSLGLLDGTKVNYHNKDVSYSLEAFPYNRTYQRTGGPPIQLATLTLSERWQNSVVGVDSPAGVKFDQAMTMGKR
jgi:hypothetical protein